MSIQQIGLWCCIFSNGYELQFKAQIAPKNCNSRLFLAIKNNKNNKDNQTSEHSRILAMFNEYGYIDLTCKDKISRVIDRGVFRTMSNICN